MAKNNEKKEAKKDISLVPVMWMGFIIILVNVLLDNFIPNYPKGLSNILYIVGVVSLVVYMIQIAFEKRTGYREVDPTVKQKKK